MNFFSKKGQIGKLITSFPIILLVIILIAVYLFIVSGMHLTRPGNDFSVSSISSVAVLFTPISIAGNDSGAFDFFVQSQKEGFPSNDIIFNALLVSLRNESLGKRCLILNLNEPVTRAAVIDSTGTKVIDYVSVASFYSGNLSIVDFSLSPSGISNVQARSLPFSLIPGKRTILVYYGGCLHE